MIMVMILMMIVMKNLDKICCDGVNIAILV